jgi:hypothetical protein
MWLGLFLAQLSAALYPIYNECIVWLRHEHLGKNAHRNVFGFLQRGSNLAI